MSIFKSTASFRDFQRPEYALKHFIRFVAAKVAVTLIHIADTLEELDNDTETLMSIGRKHLCTFATLKTIDDVIKYADEKMYIDKKKQK